MPNKCSYSINKPVSAEQLKRLFMQVDWTKPRELSDIEIMLNATTLQITAWHNNILVGFLRVLTDRVFRAMIEDIIIDKSLRGQGIGEALIKLELEELSGVKEIILGCKVEMKPYYEKFGFEEIKHLYMQKLA